MSSKGRRLSSPGVPASARDDPDRDRKTVLVMQLAARTDDRSLREFFSRAGDVKDARVILDKRGKSKGYCVCCSNRSSI